MDERDNVAIVANDGGLEAGAAFATGFAAGLMLSERVPQATRSRWSTSAKASRCVRYGIPIGYALKPIAAGSWVHERLLRDARGALARRPADRDRRARRAAAPLEGFTFEGFRNADGSVGTRNILAITTTVQCVAGVVEFAVARIKAELLPQLSERRRRGRPRAHLRLRRGDRRARRGDPDPDPAQHQPRTRTSAAR